MQSMLFEQMAVERGEILWEFVQEAQENHLNRYIYPSERVTLV